MDADGVGLGIEKVLVVELVNALPLVPLVLVPLNPHGLP